MGTDSKPSMKLLHLTVLIVAICTVRIESVSEEEDALLHSCQLCKENEYCEKVRFCAEQCDLEGRYLSKVCLKCKVSDQNENRAKCSRCESILPKCDEINKAGEMIAEKLETVERLQDDLELAKLLFEKK